MEYVISFTLSVAASVAAYYVCKWLDEQFCERQALTPQQTGSPSVFAVPRGFLLFVNLMEIQFPLHFYYTRL